VGVFAGQFLAGPFGGPAVGGPRFFACFSAKCDIPEFRSFGVSEFFWKLLGVFGWALNFFSKKKKKKLYVSFSKILIFFAKLSLSF